MKVVFDANVFISGLSRRIPSPPTILMDLWKRGTFDVFVSQHILTKVEEAWR
ncbi:MAG: PIN domain-containing protein [Chloroflexia bacterium]|nr:PIN domain-containing protein [Chloroflexia bacterium]